MNELSPRTEAEAALRHPATVRELTKMLPFRDDASKERFVTNLQMVLRNDTKLAQCEVKSVINCAFDAARLGLEVNSPLHQAVIIPRKTKAGFEVATLQLEYRGLLELMSRSGKLRNAETGIVRRNDTYRRTALDFEFECDPFGTEEVRGPIVGVYAILELTDGTRKFETMSVKEVEHVRAKSRAKADGPWVTDWNEMARKTVLRRAAKLVPWSAEDATSLEVADKAEFDFDETAEIEVKPPEPPKKGVAAVLDKVKARAAPAATPPPAEPEPPPPEPEPESVDPGAAQVPPEEPPKVAKKRPPDPTNRLPLGSDLMVHIEEADPLFRQMGYEKWQRWTSSRQKLVEAAMDAAGVDSPSQFWATVTAYSKTLGEGSFEAYEVMEDLLDAFIEARKAAA